MVIEEKLVKYLLKNNLTITTAESCTGGMVSSRLVNVEGVSSILKECHVTYSAESKIKLLNVSPDTIEKFDVVSKETAHEMAIGAAKLAGADVAISVTGLAGPGGGTKKLPVGTVCIGCHYNNTTNVKVCLFDGDRFQIRTQATNEALKMAYDMVTK